MSKPVINVTPLIDVLLVLLITFMVVTPMKPSSFEASIPSEPDKNPGVNPPIDALIVSLSPSSQLRINKEKPVQSPEEITVQLSEVFRAREQNLVKERTVFIKAPKSISYGTVAKLVDAVKISGAHPISLQIDDLD